MPREKPPVLRVGDLTAGQSADFFALLAEKTRHTTQNGKVFFNCRFRDQRRTVSFVAWSDGSWFAPAEREWQAGQFYKLRGTYGEHERYGPQIVELQNIRPVNDADRSNGFDPRQFIEASRFDPAAMFAGDGVKTPDFTLDSATFNSAIPGAKVVTFDVDGNLWVSVVGAGKGVKFNAAQLVTGGSTVPSRDHKMTIVRSHSAGRVL